LVSERVSRWILAKNNTLFFTTHEHVITCGVSSDAMDFHYAEDYYKQNGISIVKTDRGGKLTYHGPGQLVCYPIIRLDDYNLKVI
jgi:lipoyl(octanoyl) transferase